MAIAQELCSEIAAALLAGKEKSPAEMEELKQTLLVVHSTLEQMSEDEHKSTTDAQAAAQAAAKKAGANT